MQGELTTQFELWRLAAGLGLFLFGMHHLEQALQQLAGRPFKVFLRRHTSRPVKAVLAGVFATAALQSSSVVSLLVLAMVGTGIVSLSSAIAIVFGSNLGTTVTGWLVAALGFKLDIEALALPLVAAGGLGVVWSVAGTRRFGISQLAAGLGLLLLGLDFMKSGATAVADGFDPASLAPYPAIVFLAAGLLITAVIQSSSATIMITLSALYAGAVTLPAAAALAIGADLGTTITAVLASMAGSAAKKRVAAANVLFNVVANTAAFIFISPMLVLVTDVAGIQDPLFALVAFHSLINVFGIALFLPAISWLSGRLESRFSQERQQLLRHIKSSDAAVPEAAIENLTRETYRLIDQAAALNQTSLGLKPWRSFYDSESDRSAVQVFEPGANHDACYAELKQLEGEILAFAVRMQAQPLEPVLSARLNAAVSAIRNGVHAAKSMRDTRHDLQLFRDSVNDRLNEYFDRFRSLLRDFYDNYDALRNATTTEQRFEALVRLKQRNDATHQGMHSVIYREIGAGELSETEISTVLNVNREIYASAGTLLTALSETLLDAGRAGDFAAIPPTA